MRLIDANALLESFKVSGYSGSVLALITNAPTVQQSNTASIALAEHKERWEARLIAECTDPNN